jgi:hypothetical protein
VVAALAANAEAKFPAAMTATCRRTSSAASAVSRSGGVKRDAAVGRTGPAVIKTIGDSAFAGKNPSGRQKPSVDQPMRMPLHAH